MKRIGFACKYMHPNQTLPKRELEEIQRRYNGKSTTVKWLDSQNKDVAVQRLWEIIQFNIQSYKNLITYVASLPDNLHMVRLSSDCLPAYTHADWSWFYKQPDIQNYLASELGAVGYIARKFDVRLSMHPGQFTVLASDKSDVVKRSIDEFEYHADIARYMGYGKTFQDFKINVHISGRQGPKGIVKALRKMTPEARNTITIENDENSWGIEDSLDLEKHCALVLDVHHHWCYSGNYISCDSDIHKRVIDSWRGVRPVIHYSISRGNVLLKHSKNRAPQMATLLRAGLKKQKLRAHSNVFWNNAVNDYVLGFLSTSDIMCEAKYKNLASIKLYKYAKQRGWL